MTSSPDQALLDDKRRLRRSMTERRRSLAAPARAAGSRAVCARLGALPELSRAAVVAAFAALPDEIDPAAALAAACARGAVIAYPRVSRARPRLTWHRVDDPTRLRPGAFGVLEPATDEPLVSVEAVELWLVPGLAFDEAGGRLGYGGGFYDECLSAARNGRASPVVGLAFDFQIVDRCPVGDADISVDAVVTDARLLRCRGGASPAPFPEDE